MLGRSHEAALRSSAVPVRPRALGAAVAALVVLSCGCSTARRAPATTPAPTPEPQPADGVRHPVEEGQTLWRIARVYGVDLQNLAAANAIDDPSSMEIGTVLRIPGATTRLEVPPYPAPLPGVPAPVTTAGAGRALGFTWPLAGSLLSGYGTPRRDRVHRGIDIRGRQGERVFAAAAGTVVYSGSTMRGYGKTVIVDHGGGWESLYAHNSALLVREGEQVGRGQPIARVGRTGNATTEHCHFELRRDDVAIDPLPYLGDRR